MIWGKIVVIYLLSELSKTSEEFCCQAFIIFYYIGDFYNSKLKILQNKKTELVFLFNYVTLSVASFFCTLKSVNGFGYMVPKVSFIRNVFLPFELIIALFH